MKLLSKLKSQKLTSKGAMFGLDARIALAIFGALSVISGAALYSAIQHAKIIAAITEVKELEKAYDAYHLDTGVELPISSYWLKLEDLLTDNSVAGWNGPYLSWQQNSATQLKTSDSWVYLIIDLLDGTWSGSTSQAEAYCDTGTVGGTCYIWTVIYAADLPKSIIQGIEKEIDGTVDYNDGNVRHIVSGGGNDYLYVKFRSSSRY